MLEKHEDCRRFSNSVILEHMWIIERCNSSMVTKTSKQNGYFENTQGIEDEEQPTIQTYIVQLRVPINLRCCFSHGRVPTQNLNANIHKILNDRTIKTTTLARVLI